MLTWLRNPWGRPRFLPLVAGLYILWSVVPVAIAILFAFNAGRSRTTWQGFSFRWFWQDPDLSVFHDDALQGALKHTLTLAANRSINPTGARADAPSRTAISSIWANANSRRCGQTTMLSCLLGLLWPHAGEMQIGGRTVGRDRFDPNARPYGVLLEDTRLPPFLTVGEALTTLAVLRGFDTQAATREVERVTEAAPNQLPDNLAPIARAWIEAVNSRL